MMKKKWETENIKDNSIGWEDEQCREEIIIKENRKNRRIRRKLGKIKEGENL